MALATLVPKGFVCPTCSRPDVGLLQRRLIELEIDNALLAEASQTFGGLAERLNDRLRDVHAQSKQSGRA